ncbi:phosphotransferase, partial [Mesorhizobium sp. M0598]|uniref:phosphotransferase n=1 Tax=Mesorhizobium sp. M0598 TaxID=2956968 RepID=UPI003335B64C
ARPPPPRHPPRWALLAPLRPPPRRRRLGSPLAALSPPPPPVWVHGDVASGNLLVEDGKLYAVVDFGSSAIGDPACDLVIAWTEFYGESRQAFRDAIALDEHSWARARGWALWKALIVASGHDGNQREAEKSWRVIDEVLADHTNSQSGKANSV